MKFSIFTVEIFSVYYMGKVSYCLNTVFQKLHFSKSPFSETSQEKYDHVIFLQPKSHKMSRKNFENQFTNSIIMPKNYLE